MYIIPQIYIYDCEWEKRPQVKFLLYSKRGYGNFKCRASKPPPPSRITTKSHVGARHAASLYLVSQARLSPLACETIFYRLRMFARMAGNVHLRGKTLAEEGTAAKTLAVS